MLSASGCHQGAMLAVQGVPPIVTHPPAPAWRGHPQGAAVSAWHLALSVPMRVCPPRRAQLLWGWEGANRGGRGEEGGSVFFFLRDFFYSFKAETRSKGISTSSNRDHLVH